MIKGGYKIVNFNGAALSGSPEVLPDIYAQIVDDYDKPVMVSGVSLNGDIMDDAYAGVQEKVAGDLSKSVELTVYGGIITVTEDDEVSFVLSKTTAELTAEIGNLEDLETTDKDSLVESINEVKEYGDIKNLSSLITITNENFVVNNIKACGSGKVRMLALNDVTINNNITDWTVIGTVTGELLPHDPVTIPFAKGVCLYIGTNGTIRSFGAITATTTGGSVTYIAAN